MQLLEEKPEINTEIKLELDVLELDVDAVQFYDTPEEAAVTSSEYRSPEFCVEGKSHWWIVTGKGKKLHGMCKWCNQTRLFLVPINAGWSETVDAIISVVNDE